MARCVEHNKVKDVIPVQVEHIAIFENAINCGRPSDKHVKARHRAIAVLQSHVLDPLPFCGMDCNCAAGRLLDRLRRPDVVRVCMGLDDEGDLGRVTAGRPDVVKNILAPSKILHENELKMRACSVFLNKLSFDSKSTFEYCIKLRND
jgi:hypothetical protein